MRVRGLKQELPDFVSRPEVAPYAGAWIETLFCSNSTFALAVAPHAGAWIETVLPYR